MLDFLEGWGADWGGVTQGVQVSGSRHEEGHAGACVGGGGEEPFSEGWVTARDDVADLEDEVWVYVCAGGLGMRLCRNCRRWVVLLAPEDIPRMASADGSSL